MPLRFVPNKNSSLKSKTFSEGVEAWLVKDVPFRQRFSMKNVRAVVMPHYEAKSTPSTSVDHNS